MHIIVEEKRWHDGHRLVYRECSFDVEPACPGGVSSALINSLQLEVDEDGHVLYVWGYFEHPSTWKKTSREPPKAEQKSIRLVGKSRWIPGVSRELITEHWRAFVNMSRTWVGLGSPDVDHNITALEIAPETILVLKSHTVVAIWLKLNPDVKKT